MKTSFLLTVLTILSPVIANAGYNCKIADSDFAVVLYPSAANGDQAQTGELRGSIEIDNVAIEADDQSILDLNTADRNQAYGTVTLINGQTQINLRFVGNDGSQIVLSARGPFGNVTGLADIKVASRTLSEVKKQSRSRNFRNFRKAEVFCLYGL